MKISHKGHETIFDWSNDNANCIQWAAFYSDCEHEVFEVKTDHRITLSYNLYVSESVGGVLQRFPTADPSLYPLFGGAKQMLENPAFMSEGGTIGFYCAHQYAHTLENTQELMPYALTGIDATIYMIFQSLVASVLVRPIFKSDEIVDSIEDKIYNFEYRRSHPDNYPDDVSEMRREEFEASLRNLSRIGDKFHKLKLVDAQTEYDPDVELFVPHWPHKPLENIVWLNKPTEDGWDVAMVNMKYGNESSLSWSYSHAVILIKIPPRAERQIPGQGRAAFQKGT